MMIQYQKAKKLFCKDGHIYGDGQKDGGISNASDDGVLHQIVNGAEDPIIRIFLYLIAVWENFYLWNLKYNFILFHFTF